MASKFGQGENCLFPTREIAIQFLDSMLVHKFFHRAKKVPVTEAELKRGKKPEKKTDDDEKKESSTVSTTKKKEEKVTDAESSHVEGKKDKLAEKDKEKKKRKIRLDMHPDQVFVDGGEAYVWIYDPIPMHYWLFGALLVFGAIVICLFPLWPPSLRLVVQSYDVVNFLRTEMIKSKQERGLLFEYCGCWIFGLYSGFSCSSFYRFLHSLAINSIQTSFLAIPKFDRRRRIFRIILATVQGTFYSNFIKQSKKIVSNYVVDHTARLRR